MNATLADGTSVTTDIDDEVDGINGDYDVRYLNWNTINGVTGINDKFSLDDADESLVWLDKSELSYDHANLQVSNIDYEIFEYDTNDDGDVYSLIQRNTLYLDDVTINNGKGYINAPDGNDDIMIDNSTIFVNLDNNAVYTGYSEVPDIEHAYIAYVLADDANTGRVAEIVYIIDGTIYDTNNIFFVITSADRATEKEGNDLYFEFDDTYVDGRPYEDLFVSYDALIESGYMGGINSLNPNDERDDEDSNVTAEIEDELVGKVIEIRKSTEGNYATEIEVHDNWSVVNEITDSGIWVEDLDENQDIYTTASGNTTYVMIEEQYDRDGRTYDVSVGGYRDVQELAEEDDYYITLAQVVKSDDGEAQLVYIWRFIPVTITIEDGMNTYTEYVQPFVDATLDYTAPANYTIQAANPGDVVNGKIVLTGWEMFWADWNISDGFNVTVNVTLKADEATVTVENADKLNVTGSTTIDTEDGTELTISAGDKYNVTGVTCEPNKSIQISESNGVYTVVIPAGTEDVTIGTTVEEKVYNVSYADTWYRDRNVILTKAPETIGADSTIEVEITTSWEGTTSYELEVTGATGEFTLENGVAQEVGSVVPTSPAEFMNLKANYGTLYSDADCTTVVDSYDDLTTPGTDSVYWIEVEGKAPIWKGTISNATGDVHVSLG